jgi:hypothetical protein
MTQIHKRFDAEQVKVLLSSYEQGYITRSEIENTLCIGKTRFFALLKQYRNAPDSLTLEYQRTSHRRLGEDTEEKIKSALLAEKELIDNKDLPISDYNYAALKDRLQKKGVKVSTTTIIKRAAELGCYQPKKKKKAKHDREVVTDAVGDLIQHDASIHKWSPFADQKWTLITSLDDYSRMMLYVDFVESETSWAHIQAARYVMKHFGIPNRYYVDNLRVFRFIQHRDSVWKNMVLGTDDVNTQWRQVMALMNTDVVYALSPQAKGKIERPYRWLQDRIVRTCALEKVSSLDDARSVLREEVNRYNYKQIHSTTQEIPALRMENARKNNRSLFRPFALPKPFTSENDVFCIRLQRTTDGYRNISVGGQSLKIPNVEPREDVNLHFAPDLSKNLVKIRIWASKKLVYTTHLPIANLSKAVHF